MSTSQSPAFSQIAGWENLLRAYQEAARGKRGRMSAASFEHQLADHLLQLQEELLNGGYRPGPYRHFYIHDPKERKISAAPFRDRVVHHALCNVIEPWFERRFIFDSYANRVGKGTHRAVDRLQQFACRYRYVLRLDIVKHFPSIDHAILFEILARTIRDDDVLWLVDKIIASGVGVLDDEYTTHWFPGDDLLAILRPRGLPIGNLTSQFWSNCYLDPFDHFIKRELRCQAYLRYVDDFALFSDSKPELWRWKQAIVERLATLRLTVHPQAQVTPVRHGIPWPIFDSCKNIFSSIQLVTKAGARRGTMKRGLRNGHAKHYSACASCRTVAGTATPIACITLPQVPLTSLRKRKCLC